MIDRVPCEECQAEILPETAERNDGLCAICAKPTNIESPATRIKEIFRYIFLLCSLLFYLAWCVPRGLWRRLRFPFDHLELRKTARQVLADRWKARLFVYGVETGYATSAPRFSGFAQKVEYYQGKDGGGRLRRGEVDFEDIVASSDYLSLIGKTTTKQLNGEQD